MVLRVTAAVAACVGLLAAGCGGSVGSTGGAPRRTPTSTPGPHSAVLAKVHTGGSPCGVAVADGSVWVSDADSGHLLAIDPSTDKVRTVVTLDPTPCAITVAFGSLWVITQSGRLDKVDPKTGRITARIPVGQKSYQAVAGPTAIWVSNRNDATLTKVNPRTNATRTIPVAGILPGGMVYADGSLWIGDDTEGASHLLRMDPATGKVRPVTAGGRPAYLTAAGGAIWVSNVSDGTVSRIDPATDRATATVPAGTSPVNLDARPGPPAEVWVPDDTGGHVTRIDATTAKVVETIAAGSAGPALVAAGGDDVWVTMYQGGEVWRIHPAPR